MYVYVVMYTCIHTWSIFLGGFEPVRWDTCKVRPSNILNKIQNEKGSAAIKGRRPERYDSCIC